MAKILIADTETDGETFSELLQGHELRSVKTLRAAKIELSEHDFELIIATLHFDYSQMFEFLGEVRATARSSEKPVLCVCTRDTAMTRLMQETICRSTLAFGAWMYLDLSSYKDSHELRRVIDRCLTQSNRAQLLKRRIAIADERMEICRLQEQSNSQWTSSEINLSQALTLLKKTIEHIKRVTSEYKEKVDFSRSLKDRVSKSVMMREDELFELEEIQTLREVRQSMIETEIAENQFGENLNFGSQTYGNQRFDPTDE